MVKITRHIITKRHKALCVGVSFRRFFCLVSIVYALLNASSRHSLRIGEICSRFYAYVLRCVRRTLRTARLRKASRRVKFPIKQHFEEIQGFSKSLSIAWTAYLVKAFFVLWHFGFSVNFWPSKTINPF